MAQTKADILATGTVSHQEALVKRLLQKKKEPRVMIIPGGKNMLQELDSRNLGQAVYTWLRRTRFFDSVKLSLVDGSVKRAARTYRVEEFPDGPPQIRPWDRVDLGGKRWLADKIAEILGTTIVLAIEAKDDGLYLTVPEDKDVTAQALQSGEDWKPHLEFVIRGASEYKVY